ncbi:MAG: NADPH-dependent glutamate synthase [Desulfobulbus sp.]|jgi:glutamate synthase (NADPH/NADH) small chain|uniref:NADPH-dependent glutamate synthase n=1 Tax=Desulfobulbus sp. TaxID=895 RepID=UPI002843928A|nr:NADPH-dependent glutamate synthase [Desulfobulbus sp.]MDR2549081.1 NADPH-dependent glutamate synthase [Desulfobulbus sp.]
MQETQKTAKDRHPMPEQPAEVRRNNFLEVPIGYTEEMAKAEASRCIQCKIPKCMEGCPVAVPIPRFIRAIAQGQFAEGIRIIWEKNGLPAVCGRVCPQEIQCEGQCVLGKKGQPVAIGNLERFLADWERAHGDGSLPDKQPPTGKRVAVVGSGPSGLTVAGDLVLKGHAVTLFEAFHKPGGVLIYGIPEFRLPKAIVESEVNTLEKLGVEIVCNTVVGRAVDVSELLDEGYDAVFVGVGAGLPRFLNVPGENLIGVYSANEYLTRANLMKAYDPLYDTPLVPGRNVVVVGGGNVAMDSARTALRMGAESVKIVYRRSREEMPARVEESHHAEQEGVEFLLLSNPLRFEGNSEGRLTSVTCERMTLGEPDASGRRRPVPLADADFTMDCDLAIIAVGSGANPLLTSSEPAIKLNRRGNIEADSDTGKTFMRGVWAGGDIVTGAATVILAMGAGRKAADSIHDYLMRGW